MIERFNPPKLLLSPPDPALFVIASAALKCGCIVFVGWRLDNQEAATSVGACSEKHVPVIRHFNLLLAESTVDPTDEELVVVCDRLLEEAARHVLGT